MSVVYNNIIAVRGEKEQLISFLNDGLKQQGRAINDLNDEIAEAELEGLTLKSWLPDVPDTYADNVKALGVKYDTELTYYDFCEIDEDYFVLYFECSTTPWYPEEWFNTMYDKYDEISFYVFTTNEDVEWAGYYGFTEGLWMEKIVAPKNYTEDEIETFKDEIDTLKDRFIRTTEYE